MNHPDFDLAAQLAATSTPSTVDKYYGRSMARLVARLQNLPTWERLRPTPALAEREWKIMSHKERERNMNRRKARRQQTRLS
jgi:hypothetical protein